ncbi:TetR/AcrR family transcriptional regulator [Nonomuraea gerenzanensis]|uniref:Transcriptional regulator, TetR family n=1 Tax=Nonomuraea gerenzanensis TaxID=93944 RepID=A0A1M4E0U1_9ACTN|nr:TetR/AcrR family transcriptional regulator [Nonomuraea gerenzanensis]UBU14704.1 TetR/AcrR family transcriptional regulator [Nonomuraea gerenzanensis]SBO92429.1 Transcriptional regulator, TetR family [Nonomuraea gerenzanensis]
MSPRKAPALRGSDLSLRDHLVATAERLIAEHGTTGLTVRTIAREAGVADGVLYNHFADKEELLALALRAHVRTVGRGLGELPGPGAPGSVREHLRAYVVYGIAFHKAVLPAFAGLVGQPKVLSAFAAISVPGEDWRDRLHGYLRAEVELGRLAPGAKVDAAAAMIAGVCHEAVLARLLYDVAAPPEPTAEFVDDLVGTVLDGIGP